MGGVWIHNSSEQWFYRQPCDQTWLVLSMTNHHSSIDLDINVRAHEYKLIQTKIKCLNYGTSCRISFQLMYNECDRFTLVGNVSFVKPDWCCKTCTIFSSGFIYLSVSPAVLCFSDRVFTFGTRESGFKIRLVTPTP